VGLAASEFANPSAATVDELVTALNADLAGAATARNVGGRLVLRSDSSGAGATLSLTDGAGSPLAALGLPAGVTRNGQADAVDVQVAGRYQGSANGQLVFVPTGDGQIGVTPGLKVDVLDSDGKKVATLDVGREYSPGKALEVADGVTVAFGSGTVSASAHDVFALDTLADSDTSDVLVALGLNSFFTGSTAADLAVDPELLANTDRLAAGLGTAPGDAANLERFLTLRSSALDLLDGQSFENHYESTVADIGFETASARATLEAQEQLLAHIQAQREAVSGVNIDEEMVDLVRHQQSFEAASRFINVVGELTRSVINIGGS
jgi:flagellar hook-associated protein 1 FlgK